MTDNLTTPGTTCAEEYTVKRGDSFYLIAHKLGVPLRDLLAANRDIHPARLMVGDVLCIPREEDDSPDSGGLGGNQNGSAGGNGGNSSSGTGNGSGSTNGSAGNNGTGNGMSGSGTNGSVNSGTGNGSGSTNGSTGSNGTSNGMSGSGTNGSVNNGTGNGSGSTNGSTGSNGTSNGTGNGMSGSGTNGSGTIDSGNSGTGNGSGSTNGSTGNNGMSGSDNNGSGNASTLNCPIGQPFTVQRGQSVSDIQLRSLLSRHTLETANPQVDLDSLRAGQTICVPTQNVPCPLPATYTLQASDNLETVALMFNLPVSSLLRANPCLAPQDFEAGVTVVLPS